MSCTQAPETDPPRPPVRNGESERVASTAHSLPPLQRGGWGRSAHGLPEVRNSRGWTRGDSARALGWFTLALAARAPLVARIEGILDHDQSIVGLMALDIAAGRRFPIFFDGQRYMGAVEPYVAGLLVALFGHSPVVVALAPWLFFGLFVAGQYALWRCWGDRLTGHIAALVSVLCAPMLVLWAIVPRGGYIELLAWAIPVLAVYRAWTEPGAPRPSRGRQAAWGFLFAFGYFLNPLSLIVYLTLALDWTFGRHGAELRRARIGSARWVDSRAAPLIWAALGGLSLLVLAVCCHVKMHRGGGKTPYVFLLDKVPDPWGTALGALGVVGLLVASAWWSGLGRGMVERLAEHTSFALGAIAALTPFAIHALCVRLGLIPLVRSLPIWIRGPWDIGVNLRDGVHALGTLVGSAPDGPVTVLIGQGIDPPAHICPAVARALSWTSPFEVALVGALIASVAWRDRRAWQRLWSLRGEEPTPPTVLALLGLGVTAILYTLQATSRNASSVRYLVPAWIFLPGLLATAVRALPGPGRWATAVLLLVPWTAAQANLWVDIDRPSPLRPLADALDRRGVRVIVADTPTALVVANLTRGRVGALEYRSRWPRLGDRYAGRFSTGRPVTCVSDLTLSWSSGGDQAGIQTKPVGERLHELAKLVPGRVRRVWTIDHFEVWEVDLPLAEIFDRDALPLPAGSASAKLSGASPARP